MKIIRVETYYIVKECECGGLVNIAVGNTEYLTSPPRRDYQCNKCGKVYCLSQNEYPHYKHKQVEEGNV